MGGRWRHASAARDVHPPVGRDAVASQRRRLAGVASAGDDGGARRASHAAPGQAAEAAGRGARRDRQDANIEAERGMTRDAGFSLVEVIVATALTMSVTGAVVSLATPAGKLSPALPEAVDLQQRARVIENVLVQELARAGAGLSAGPWSGALVESFAPVVPRRMGLLQADAFTAARADAITIRYVPDTSSQTTVSAFTASAPSHLTTTQTPGCPAAPLCGLAAGSDLFVFDNLGHASTFTVQQLQAPIGVLDAHDVSATYAFQPGDAVAEAVSRTYYFDPAQRQLRQYRRQSVRRARGGRGRRCHVLLLRRPQSAAGSPAISRHGELSVRRRGPARSGVDGVAGERARARGRFRCRCLGTARGAGRAARGSTRTCFGFDRFT